VMRALGELKMRCPEHVSVLGFDDFEWAANFSPRLTTVAQPTYEMGCQAMELLIRKMKSEDNQPRGGRVITLRNELKIRESTVSPPLESRENGHKALE
jgi:DNA-binding LacI/PurR family transcriptional regulator